MIISMDIGGTFSRILLNDKIMKFKTSQLKKEYIYDLIQKYNITHIGVSFAGQITNNQIISSPNTSIDNTFFDFIKQYAKVKIENDVKCAGLFYADKYNSHFALLFSGTGLGSCYFDDKEIRGVSNLAGEIGHIPYKKAPFKCGCGKDNCIELFASGSGIKKWLDFYKMDKSLTLLELKDTPIFENYIIALQYAISIIITMLNPKILILGGGVIENNQWILEKIRLKNYTFFKSLENCEIKINKIEEVNLKGALKLWK